MEDRDPNLNTVLPPKLPRLGERLNDYCVTLTAEEASRVLGYLGLLAAQSVCAKTRCDACQGLRLLWWGLCDALRPSDRDRLYCSLAGLGIPLPLYPYEDETP